MESQTIQNLISTNVLKVGTKAADNPDFSKLTDFALGIANKDYEAKTPWLWNGVYKKLNLPQRNIRTFGNPEDAPQIFEALKSDRRYIGGDVGVGFKDKVLSLLDDIDPLAQVMGAINVVAKKDGKLKGYNTDGEGYAKSLEKVFGGSLSGKKIVLLGAGGTGNAIAVALAGRGAKIVILNRTRTKAVDLANRVNWHFGWTIAKGAGREQIRMEVFDADAVIACIDEQGSPLDQYSALGQIDLPLSPAKIARNLSEAQAILKHIPRHAIVSDVMLRPHDTATIATAKAAGFRTLDGNPMVLNQAIEAFWLVNESGLKAIGCSKERVGQIMRDISGSAD